MTTLIGNVHSIPKSDLLLANVHRWDQLAGLLQATFPLENIPLYDHIGGGATILDYGCGEGRFLAHMANNYTQLIGCDTSRRMCHLAQTAVKTATVVAIADPRSLSSHIAEFDVVVMVAVLSSVVPTDERRALVRRLWQRLPNHGVMVLADFGRSTAPSYLSRYQNAVLEAYTIRTAEGLLIHHFSLDELVGLVPPGGRVEVARTVAAHTVHGNPIPGHVAVVRKAH